MIHGAKREEKNRKGRRKRDVFFCCHNILIRYVGCIKGHQTLLLTLATDKSISTHWILSSLWLLLTVLYEPGLVFHSCQTSGGRCATDVHLESKTWKLLCGIKPRVRLTWTGTHMLLPIDSLALWWKSRANQSTWQVGKWSDLECLINYVNLKWKLPL